MLKKNYNYTIIYKLLYFFQMNLNNVVSNRILSLPFFWVYITQMLSIFKFKKIMFFFKFIYLREFEQDRKKRKYYKRRHLIRKKRRTKKKFHYRVKVKLSWFFFKIKQAKWPLKRRQRFIKRFKHYRLWLRKFWFVERKQRIKKQFMRFLKIRLKTSHLRTGILLFKTTKRNNLKKLFKIFRLSKNKKIFFNFFIKKFLFFIFFKKLKNKYWNCFKLFSIFTGSIFKINHLNILKKLSFDFKKRSESKRKLRFVKKKKSLRKRRRWKIKRRLWLKFTRHKLFGKRVIKTSMRTITIHREFLTSLYFNNINYKNYFFYYINMLFNIWNIRSYNWKQIT